MSKLGTLVSDFKKAGEAVKAFIIKVADDAPAVMATIASDTAKIAPVIEAFVPGSTAAINLGDTLVDAVAQAVEDAGDAASSNGLSVSLDQTTVNAVKSVIAAAKAFAPAATSAASK